MEVTRGLLRILNISGGECFKLGFNVVTTVAGPRAGLISCPHNILITLLYQITVAELKARRKENLLGMNREQTCEATRKGSKGKKLFME